MATYPLDLTGQAATNRISNEQWNVGPNSWAFVPNQSPFYTSGFIIQNANGTPLMPNVQYKAVELNLAATTASGMETCGAILITDETQAGQITITYQCVGGTYSGSNATIQQVISTLPLISGKVQWAQILNPPSTYPPADHTQDASTIYGLDEVVYSLEGIRQAVLLGDQHVDQMMYAYINQMMATVPITQTQLATLNQSISSVLNTHLAAIYPSTNAHTPITVGLSNIQNWSVGSQADHQAGTPDRYASCSGVLTLLQNLGITGTGSGIANISAQSIGLGNVQNWGVATNAQTVTGVANLYTSASGVAYAISQITAGDLNLGNVANLAPADMPISTATQAALASKVNTNFTITTAGALTGGGNLQNNTLTLNVPFATNADAEAATSISLVMTPVSTKAAILQSAPVLTVAGKTGNVTLTPADVGLSNLQILVQNVVSNTTTVTGAGLITGGGALTSNLTLTLNASTLALAQAGIDNTTAMTPATTKAAILQSAPVLTVAGKTGNVTLTPADVGLGGVINELTTLVPNTTTVTGAGLATGGGALNNNLVITVNPSTAVLATGGADSTTVMTPLSTAQAIAVLAPSVGRLIDIQVYPKAGTYIWNRPNGMGTNGFLIIEGCGAGGSGASLPVTNNSVTIGGVLVGAGIGGGGCAGAYGKFIVPYVETANTITITVGSGGVLSTGAAYTGASGNPTVITMSATQIINLTGGTGGQYSLYNNQAANTIEHGTLPSVYGNNGITLEGFNLSYAIGGYLGSSTLIGKGLTVPLESTVLKNGYSTIGQYTPITGGFLINPPNGEQSPMCQFLKPTYNDVLMVAGTSYLLDSTVYGVYGAGPGSGGNGCISIDSANLAIAQAGSDGYLIIYTYA